VSGVGCSERDYEAKFGGEMKDDRRRKRRPPGLCFETETAILDTLGVIDNRVRELEKEARRLRSLRLELDEKAQEYERCEPGMDARQFFEFTKAARRECLRILRHLAAETPGENCRVLVIKVPVYVQPKPSRN
jgi:hypothetical protein